MSEASYLVELREAAPKAPERLRELVRTLPAAEQPRGVPARPALVAAAAIALAIALAGALIGGLTGSGSERHGGTQAARAQEPRTLAPHGAQLEDSRQYAPSLTAKSRLQRQDISMSLRVKDLSAATQQAVGTTRRLGGFVAGADYSTDTKAGNSRLPRPGPLTNPPKVSARLTHPRT